MNKLKMKSLPLEESLMIEVASQPREPSMPKLSN